ncbi:MAG: ABC transporter substrate-binding protein, partial [Gammaproteobacteria bacterium]
MRRDASLFPARGLVCLLCLASVFAVAEPVRETSNFGGVLRVGLLARPGTLNPAMAVTPVVTVPGAQIFASLFRLDAELKPHPYLAKSWNSSTDGLCLAVELVSNAKFHDGRPVTARDAAFSIEATRINNGLWGMLDAVDRVDVLNEYSLEIRLKHPHPALLMALSAPLTPILPAHVYDDGRPLYENPANLRPVGSGPFRFVRWETDGRLVLERFEDYFIPGLPYLKRLEFDYYPVSAQIPLALADGDIDLFSFLTRYIGAEIVQAHPELVGVDDGQSGISMPMNGLAFNLRRPPFNDRRVRRAIAGVLDNQYIHERLLQGRFIPARGVFPPGSRFASEQPAASKPDVVEANRLLEEAGLVRDENGMRFGLSFLYVHGDPAMQAFVDYLRWTLGSQLGIELKPDQAVDYRQYLARASAGDFDMMFDVRLVWGDP